MSHRLVILTEIISPYRIPLFNALAAHAEIDLDVIFLAETDPDLRQWRIYKEEIRFRYQVLPSWRKRIAGYNLLLNSGLGRALRLAAPDAILCGGYNYVASWQALFWARAHGVPFLLWSESNVQDMRGGHALIEFAKDESTLYFRIGPRLLTSRQLTGQFPNYEAVLPKDNSKSVTVSVADLNAAVSRVEQFADERSRAVRLRFEKGEVKISASSTETGESEDSIEATYDGETLTIGFNAKYLLDFLKAVGSGDVKLELKDAQSAGQLRPAESEDYKYRYIVMPMRI